MSAMHEVLEKIGKIGIIPVIKIDDAEHALPLARALAAGGIPCVEITFRTAAAGESIRRISREVPGMLLGAGTVLSIEQAERAISAGAQFIVSPGLNPAVTAHCIEKGVPVIPGCVTPSEIEKALELGLSVLKFFPAEQAGGIEYIKAVSAPFPAVSFIPCGGINAQNIRRYLAFGKVLACGGSWMAGAELIAAGDFDTISRLAREAALALLDMRLTRIGINAGSTKAAVQAAAALGALFGFTVTENADSVFTGSSIEILKRKGPGKHGHIAIASADLRRAIAYLERLGVELDYDSAFTDSQGAARGIYLKDEILGFAVQVCREQ